MPTTQNEKIAIILPTRKGSQRVKSKNTKDFCGIEGGLLYIKLSQLLKLDNVHVYLSTNDDESIEVAREKFKGFENLSVVERPDALCTDETKLTDLIKYIPTIVKENTILWTHVTSPFVEAQYYNSAIETYFKKLDEGYDSLMSVEVLKEFVWDIEKNEVLNRKSKELKWPRTQDLQELNVVNSGIFICDKSFYLLEDRVGDRPYLYPMDKLNSLDIDWEEDFKIAEVLYREFRLQDR